MSLAMTVTLLLGGSFTKTVLPSAEIVIPFAPTKLIRSYLIVKVCFIYKKGIKYCRNVLF